MTGSRLATAFLLLRLASAKKDTLGAKVVSGMIGIWGFASILAVAIRPSSSPMYETTQTSAATLVSLCFSQFTMNAC